LPTRTSSKPFGEDYGPVVQRIVYKSVRLVELLQHLCGFIIIIIGVDVAYAESTMRETSLPLHNGMPPHGVTFKSSKKT
jgi:hypothetical protein